LDDTWGSPVTKKSKKDIRAKKEKSAKKGTGWEEAF